MKKFLLAAVLILAACDQSSAQNESSGVSSSPAQPPASIAVGEPNPATPPTMPSADACNPNQDWVGKKKDEVDMSGIKALRVIYPNQPVTMDYSPERLNVILEEGTDIITEVRCG